MQLRSRFTTLAILRVHNSFVFDRNLGLPVGLVEPGAGMFSEAIALLALLGVMLGCNVDLIGDLHCRSSDVIRKNGLLFRACR